VFSAIVHQEIHIKRFAMEYSTPGSSSTTRIEL
jgi:hypothetical protein